MSQQENKHNLSVVNFIRFSIIENYVIFAVYWHLPSVIRSTIQSNHRKGISRHFQNTPNKPIFCRETTFKIIFCLEKPSV